MKRYLRLAIFFAVAAAAVSAAYLVRESSSPMSSIIAKQRDGLFLSRDKGRAENDPAYARELEERLRFLDYRRALALNAENRPDAAIAVLEELIKEEEAKEKADMQRNSRSYLNEARYYEAMAESLELKQDENNANTARHKRLKLLSKALELNRQKNRGEGRSVGSDVD